MEVDYKPKIILGMATGLTMQFLGILLWKSVHQEALMLLVLGQVVFMLGCTGYAQMRGYAAWLGLSGLASIFGFLVLISLPREPVEEPIKSPLEVRGIGRRNIAYGLLWFFGGVAVTAISMAAAWGTGAVYVIFWGAIVFGAIQTIRGISQVLKSHRLAAP